MQDFLLLTVSTHHKDGTRAQGDLLASYWVLVATHVSSLEKTRFQEPSVGEGGRGEGGGDDGGLR